MKCGHEEVVVIIIISPIPKPLTHLSESVTSRIDVEISGVKLWSQVKPSMPSWADATNHCNVMRWIDDQWPTAWGVGQKDTATRAHRQFLFNFVFEHGNRKLSTSRAQSCFEPERIFTRQLIVWLLKAGEAKMGWKCRLNFSWFKAWLGPSSWELSIAVLKSMIRPKLIMGGQKEQHAQTLSVSFGLVDPMP